ncbi:MAG: flagellar biosynthesis protein FlhF [Bdellovibrionales bacterium RIFCSPHIGHO2_01_FULL_40_29]|nr:MAG: flagellar biosynthesis protein FlhF [Bdellovibrionales bacterium RIFCSPHIGHO2_01_FULL_40_29]OFZ32827.1 MAG: flagellar biosynthesis protein FlhF [Bdellovibrionales bacterium RIFCSPHIGHO2_02_FULL_40_15]
MQVKKFEARTMKEALDMVKTQLGPDAIILSAKEITKGFGLGGEKSIEITAAYSDANVQKKKFAESKMPDATREKFLKSSAKSQKEITQKMIENHVARMNQQVGLRAKKLQPEASKVNYQRTEKRYIDIDNDNQATNYSTTQVQLNATTPVTQYAQKKWNDMEVNQLKSEIEGLKSLVQQFKPVPQNFVHSHPGAEAGVHYEYTNYYKKLVQRGLLPEIAADIVTQAQKQIDLKHIENKNLIENWIGKYILDTTPVVTNSTEQFHLFIGASGTGKTSSLIKLASDLILNQRKRVAIISADNLKVGASEQMKIFCQILNVPFLLLRSQQDWSHIIPHLDQIDHILVDFSGLNMRTQEEFNYLKRMSPPVYNSLRTHLVMSCLTKDGDLFDMAQRFEKFGFDDVIFNDLDKSAIHGNIYNFVRKVNTKLFAFGIGPQVPEDFERATPERVVDLILEISKNSGRETTTNSYI